MDRGSIRLDTGLRVACFYVANTSPARVDRPDWPRVTSVGFELPGSPSGFSLVAPLDGDWELVEGTRVFLPGHGPVTLDFAIVARPRCGALVDAKLPVEPAGYSAGAAGRAGL